MCCNKQESHHPGQKAVREPRLFAETKEKIGRDAYRQRRRAEQQGNTKRAHGSEGEIAQISKKETMLSGMQMHQRCDVDSRRGQRRSNGKKKGNAGLENACDEEDPRENACQA